MHDVCQRLAKDVDGVFPEVVEVMRHDLYSGLRRLQPNDAEDLTQETFIRAYRSLKEYPPQRIRQLQLRGWLWTIALNLGRNHARDRARRPIPVMLHDRYQSEDPELPDADAWDKRLGALSAPQRKAVVLRHVVGMGTEEIAVVLDRPVGTVKADIHRGLAKLRTLLEDE